MAHLAVTCQDTCIGVKTRAGEQWAERERRGVCGERSGGAEIGSKPAEKRVMEPHRWADMAEHAGAGAKRGAEVAQWKRSGERADSSAHSPLIAITIDWSQAKFHEILRTCNFTGIFIKTFIENFMDNLNLCGDVVIVIFLFFFK